MSKLITNAKAVFPFPISGCDQVAIGAECLLHPGPHWPGFIHGNGVVEVTGDDTSFKFTVVSDDYFDKAGSTIKFSLAARGGDLYLTQQAIGYAKNPILKTGPVVAWADWQVQADGARMILDPPKIAGLIKIDTSIAYAAFIAC